MRKQKHTSTVFVAVFVVLLSAKSAYANVASVFTWMTMYYLLAGNAVLGVIEGLVIAKIFKVSKKGSILFMIAANYFSSWVGFLGLVWLSSLFKLSLSRWVTVNSIYYFVWLLVFITWLATIILEYPFCICALWKKNKRLAQAAEASLVAQTLSYVLLLIFNSPFGHFSGNPIGRYKVNFVPPSSFVDYHDATIYFISIFDGDLYKVKPDGSFEEKVAALNVTHEDVRLIATADPNSKSYRLYFQKEPSSLADFRSLAPLVDTGVTLSGFAKSLLNVDPNQDNWYETAALDLRPDSLKSSQNFQVSTHRLGANSWLYVTNIKPNRWLKVLAHLQFDPFILDWSTHNATVLPSGQIVYQLGSQIVLFDVNKHKLGLITLGRSPVVFLEEEPVVAHPQ